MHLITSVKIQSAANRVDNPLNPDSLYYLLSQTDTSAGRGFAAKRAYFIPLAAMRYWQKYEEYLLTGVVEFTRFCQKNKAMVIG